MVKQLKLVVFFVVVWGEVFFLGGRRDDRLQWGISRFEKERELHVFLVQRQITHEECLQGADMSTDIILTQER